MIAKGCPKCEQQVPVACKACPCGHAFLRKASQIQQQLLVASTSSSGDDSRRRRTQRVRREKPDYYDSLEYDKQIKKSKKLSECDNDEEGGRRVLSKPKRKKTKKEEDDDGEIINHLSADRQMQCSMILAELNQKMQLVMWKPQF